MQTSLRCMGVSYRYLQVFLGPQGMDKVTSMLFCCAKGLTRTMRISKKSRIFAAKTRNTLNNKIWKVPKIR